MKLKKKIILLVLPIILYSCSRLQKGGIGDDGINRVEVEIPYFGELYTFDFYGREISVKVDKDLIAIDPTINPDSDSLYNDIKQLVKDLKDKKFDRTIEMLIAQSDTMKLDDFGYRLLLKKFSKEVFQDQSKNFREVVLWYGLRTKNLDATIYTNGKKIACFFQSGELFLHTEEYRGKNEFNYYPHFTIGEITYWNEVRLKGETFKNLNELGHDIFPTKSRNSLKFKINVLPELGKDINIKKRKFTYKSKVYHLKTSYNKYYVRYLNDLPMNYLGRQYFTRNFSKEVRESFDSIPIWISNRKDYDKFSFLLTLVDEAFPHSGGDKIEKWNYVEQTMKDDYVDCEDRAIVFCYLVEEFTNFRSSLVLGDHHAWSAISDKIKFTDGYFMCDPGLEFGDMLNPNKPYEILDPN